MSIEQASERYELARVKFEIAKTQNVYGLDYQDRIKAIAEYKRARMELEEAKEALALTTKER